MGKQYRRSKRTYRRVFKTPNRPWEKERLERELKLCGSYGLRNKREIWRVNLQLSKLRRKARVLLTLDLNDPVRLVEGAALLRKCKRYGLIADVPQTKLDHILGLEVRDFFERTLQTVVYSNRLAPTIFKARQMIQHGHILIGNQRCVSPAAMVRVDSEKHVRISPFSPCSAAGPPGRSRKRKLRSKGLRRRGFSDRADHEASKRTTGAKKVKKKRTY